MKGKVSLAKHLLEKRIKASLSSPYHVRLALETIFDLVDIVDGMVELDRLLLVSGVATEWGGGGGAGALGSAAGKAAGGSTGIGAAGVVL